MKLPIVNTLLLVAILTYVIVNSVDPKHEKKDAYIVTGELFDQFDYQKELDQEYKDLHKSRMKNIELSKLNVLKLEKNARMKNATEEDISKYQQSYNQFLQMESEINNELAETSGQYRLKVWDKLNSLVSQFGEENNYEIILGAGGDGNIMYAEQKKNITEELTAYCNLKYNGE
ncbi:OmpH family outer membrane protein [Crocinitomix catalasitica]|uniref:OmpH family outer membrane protein n=1 Tax=Crocinitomix catalasitica TaxID=184607 RepID=UPI001B804582|nr:OmpH family outer membrane protein [Crocinitomix catalasitica]